MSKVIQKKEHIIKVAKDSSYGTGKRKNAIVKTWVFNGKGNISINNQTLKDYFKSDSLVYVVLQPLKLLDVDEKLDIVLKASGGGLVGQADAARHGIARALEAYEASNRKALKQAGFLTRDPRVKERKKYGRKKARKGYQYRKR